MIVSHDSATQILTITTVPLAIECYRCGVEVPLPAVVRVRFPPFDLRLCEDCRDPVLAGLTLWSQLCCT